MRAADIVASVLVIVGAVNWGLWGAFEFDLVAAIFGGATTALAKVVYILVGLAGIYELARWKALHPRLTHGAQSARVAHN